MLFCGHFYTVSVNVIDLLSGLLHRLNSAEVVQFPQLRLFKYKYVVSLLATDNVTISHAMLEPNHFLSM